MKTAASDAAVRGGDKPRGTLRKETRRSTHAGGVNSPCVPMADCPARAAAWLAAVTQYKGEDKW